MNLEDIEWRTRNNLIYVKRDNLWISQILYESIAPIEQGKTRLIISEPFLIESLRCYRVNPIGVDLVELNTLAALIRNDDNYTTSLDLSNTVIRAKLLELSGLIGIRASISYRLVLEDA